jgi:putative membrane protein
MVPPSDQEYEVGAWALPWEFSPAVLACCAAAIAAYAFGIRREQAAGTVTSYWRRAAFYLGIALVYIPLQTRFDYLAQHMFWIHRLQHLLLHHVGPIFIALAAPWRSLAAGLPSGWRASLRSVAFSSLVRGVYGVLQQPVLAVVLFTGLIYFWLWPSIHFRAMLSSTEYEWMNWSMVVDGLLFWWLMLDPRSREEGARMGLGARIPLVLLAMGPQLLIGAFLSLHKQVIYDVYAVCGRLWPIDPVTDQQIGGLITWIPASMMSVVVSLIVLQRWMKNDDRVHTLRTGASARTGAIVRL